MSTQQPPAGRQDDSNQEDWPEPDADELRRLEEQMEELHEQGILIKGAGLHGRLTPVAYIPGAVERFLAARGSRGSGRWRPR